MGWTHPSRSACNPGEPALNSPIENESRGLTGLRGIGAALVICHHLFLHLGLNHHAGMLEGLLQRGYLGVDLFFVLSGFVLALVYGRWFQDAGSGLWLMPAFLVRRIARLWPLHLAMLAVVILLGSLTPHGETFSRRMLLMNVTMTQAWGFGTEINAPAWSISTEMIAYLFFPALAPLVLRSRAGLVAGPALVIGALAVCLTLAPPVGLARRGVLDIYFNYSLLPALRCLAGFILGLTTWRAGQVGRIQAIARTAWAGPLAFLAITVMLAAGAPDLVIFATLPLLVLGMHLGRGFAWRGIATGPVHALGVLSYAVYLIHFTLLAWFPFGWAPLWMVLNLYLATMLMLAIMAHHIIEAPGRRLLRRLGDQALALLTLPLPAVAGKPPLQGDPG